MRRLFVEEMGGVDLNALSVFGGNYYGASKTVTVPVGNGFIFLSLTYSESSQMGIIVVDKNKEVKEIKNK